MPTIWLFDLSLPFHDLCCILTIYVSALSQYWSFSKVPVRNEFKRSAGRWGAPCWRAIMTITHNPTSDSSILRWIWIPTPRWNPYSAGTHPMLISIQMRPFAINSSLFWSKLNLRSHSLDEHRGPPKCHVLIETLPRTFLSQDMLQSVNELIDRALLVVYISPKLLRTICCIMSPSTHTLWAPVSSTRTITPTISSQNVFA